MNFVDRTNIGGTSFRLEGPGTTGFFTDHEIFRHFRGSNAGHPKQAQVVVSTLLSRDLQPDNGTEILRGEAPWRILKHGREGTVAVEMVRHHLADLEKVPA